MTDDFEDDEEEFPSVTLTDEEIAALKAAAAEYKYPKWRDSIEMDRVYNTNKSIIFPQDSKEKENE